MWTGYSAWLRLVLGLVSSAELADSSRLQAQRGQWAIEVYHDQRGEEGRSCLMRVSPHLNIH